MKFILAFTLIFFSSFTYAQSEKEIVEETVQRNEIEYHIKVLSSDSLEGRDTGSPGLEMAAKYIEDQLESYGVRPHPNLETFRQKVPLERITPPEEGKIVIGDSSYLVSRDFLVMSGTSKEFEGAFIFVNFGNEDDLDNESVEGKWVVAYCGNGQSPSPIQWLGDLDTKRNRIVEAGAIGLIELYNSPQFTWDLIARARGGEGVFIANSEDNKLDEFPHLWLDNTGNKVAFQLDSLETIGVQFSERAREEIDAFNIVGIVEGTETPDEYVVYSAHYDHVGIGRPDDSGDNIYNGARDNAVGTVTVLSSAKSIGKYPTKRSSLFVFFTAEEKGLLGSEWFVNNPPIPLNQMIFCFNSDNGGYNDTTKATIQGLERNTASADIVEACAAFGIEAIKDPVPQYNLFDRSDNVNFARKGVPDFTFSMGFTDFNEEITKYYHQAADQAETLDFEYLERFFKAYVHAARVMANRAEKPFWVEGDKYYKAGEDLYR